MLRLIGSLVHIALQIKSQFSIRSSQTLHNIFPRGTAVLRINKLNTFRAVGGVLKGPKDDLESRKILIHFFVVRNEFLETSQCYVF